MRYFAFNMFKRCITKDDLNSICYQTVLFDFDDEELITFMNNLINTMVFIIFVFLHYSSTLTNNSLVKILSKYGSIIRIN